VPPPPLLLLLLLLPPLRAIARRPRRSSRRGRTGDEMQRDAGKRTRRECGKQSAASGQGWGGSTGGRELRADRSRQIADCRMEAVCALLCETGIEVDRIGFQARQHLVRMRCKQSRLLISSIMSTSCSFLDPYGRQFKIRSSAASHTDSRVPIVLLLVSVSTRGLCARSGAVVQ
jgi:hypothetical protein